jgi:hypothetical protein
MKAFAHLERTSQRARVGQRRVDCSISQAAVERRISQLHGVQEVYSKCAVARADLDHVAKAGDVLGSPSRHWQNIQMRKVKAVVGRGVKGQWYLQRRRTERTARWGSARSARGRRTASRPSPETRRGRSLQQTAAA